MRFADEFSALGIKVAHPDLSWISRLRRPDQSFAIRRKTRPLLVIRRFAQAPRFTTARRHDPQMRNFRVRLKIDLGRGKYDPFAVRRRHWLVHALELHHILKREGMLRVLSERGNGEERE